MTLFGQTKSVQRRNLMQLSVSISICYAFFKKKCAFFCLFLNLFCTRLPAINLFKLSKFPAFPQSLPHIPQPFPEIYSPFPITRGFNLFIYFATIFSPYGVTLCHKFPMRDVGVGKKNLNRNIKFQPGFLSSQDYLRR